MHTPVRTSLCVALAVVVPWVLLVGEFVVLISWLDGDLAWELERRGVSQYSLGLGLVTANAAVTLVVCATLARIGGWRLFVSTVIVVAVAGSAFVTTDLISSQARGAVGVLATSAAVLIGVLSRRPTARAGTPGLSTPAGT